MPQRGELHIRQALHRFLKIVDLRLGEKIEGEIRPGLVDLKKRFGLDVTTKLVFEEIVIDVLIRLVVRHPFHREVCADRDLVRKRDPMALARKVQAGDVGASGFIIMRVVIFDIAFAEFPEAIREVRSDTNPAPLPVIQMKAAIQSFLRIPLVRREQEGAMDAAETGREIKMVDPIADGAPVAGKIKNGNIANAQGGIFRFEIFVRNNREPRGSNFVGRSGVIIRRHQHLPR